MIFSKPHLWQKSYNVRQVLVFMLDIDRSNFERKFLVKGVEHYFSNENHDDRNVEGVVVKLRAVLYSDGKWIPIIRTADGTLIKESLVHCDTWEEAIKEAKNLLRNIF